MSLRITNFEFAREFLRARIVDTEADVAAEEEGERVTTGENQFVDISPRMSNGVLIFAILDVGARRQLRVNRRNRMSLTSGLLRLREFRVMQYPEIIRLQVILRRRVVLREFLERLVGAIRVVEPEAVRPEPVQDEAIVIE
jgi:hypothetical protein